jgi:guanylate kinase
VGDGPKKDRSAATPLETRGRLIVLSGPSGAGKSSILHRLTARPGFRPSISATTRPRRKGERDGVDYTFVDRESFERLVAEGQFIEHALVHGNHYGTLVSHVRDILDEGAVCVLDIDVQGARALRDQGLDSVFVFVAPPSLEELERRLRTRGTDDEAAIARRLVRAREELEEKGMYDLCVENDVLDRAVDEVVDYLEERGVTPHPGKDRP